MPTRNVFRVLSLVCVSALGCECAVGQPSTLVDLLKANRYELTVQNGDMNGPGAVLLRKELAASQFVAIGEEHGTREVPQFVWATCRAMAQTGLDAMAVEAGPLVTAKLQHWTSDKAGSADLLSFEKQYPGSIAFFNWRQEFDLLSHCQQAASPHPLRLWGLDQEFLGSPQFILQNILETRPGREVETMARTLQAQCVAEMQQAILSGSWSDACMLRLSAKDLSSLQSAAERAGSARAKALVTALIKTQHIYATHEGGHRYEANRERALLMKHHFLVAYQQLAQSLQRPPRVLLKFGGNHIFKGFDETNLADLGNFVSELADGREATSLHIEVLGIRGSYASQSGPGRPDQAIKKDAEWGPVAPIYAEAYAQSWTLFDLRPLRGRYADLGHLDREIERLIFGYDMLVLIPEVTPQTAIE